MGVHWGWVVAAGVAGVAVTSGVAYAMHESSKQLQSSPLTTVITDPNTIKQAQTILAQAIQGGSWPNGPTTVGFALDGNAQGLAWMQAVQSFQRFANTAFPASQWVAPPGFPQQLRTDGVLDYATYLAMVNA